MCLVLFCSSTPLGQLRALHLDTQEVAEADLSDIITDELVVLKVSTGNIGVSGEFSGVGLSEVSDDEHGRRGWITYHGCTGKRGMNASRILPSLGCGLTLTPGTESTHLFGGLSCLIAGTGKSLHWLAQFSLAKKEKCISVRVVCRTVVCAFARHVSQVDTLLHWLANVLKREFSQHTLPNM